MRKYLLSAAILLAVAATALLVPTIHRSMAQNQKKELRDQQRAARIKEREIKRQEYARHMDSIVLSHNFIFSPTSFQMQPAGMSHTITNTMFDIIVSPDYTDIYIPYIKGIVPPYTMSVIDYVAPYTSDYVTEQGENVWTVSFKTSMFDGVDYTFKFTIYTISGSATLDLSSDLYNTVSYNGYITGRY